MSETAQDQKVAFFRSLIAAQARMDSVTKDAKNPHFKSNYASLEAVLDVVKPALNAEGVGVFQPSTFIRSQDGLTTTLVTTTFLVHTSGYSEEFTTEMVVKSNPSPQEQGSAISYNRRYSLLSLFALSTEDDDGNEATKRPADESEKVAVWEKAIKSATKEKLENLKKQLASTTFSDKNKDALEKLIESREDK